MKKGLTIYALLLADLAAIVLAFRAAYGLRYALDGLVPVPVWEPFRVHWPAILFGIALWMLLFRSLEMDRLHGGALSFAISHLVPAEALLVVCMLAASYLARIYYSRLLLAFFAVILLAMLAANRAAYQAILTSLRRYGLGLRRVVIVGKSPLAVELAERIQKHRELHYELVGFLFPSTGKPSLERCGQRSGASDEMLEQLVQQRVDELIFALPIRRDTEILEFVARCQKAGIAVKFIPEYYELHASRLESFSVDGIPLLELKETSIPVQYRLVKAAMDYSIALILLMLGWPLMVVIGAVLAIITKGHPLRREIYVGQGGQPFVLYRFNALLPSSANVQEDSWKARFCRFLVRYSFSELPQLWNVLKGDMSLVGPRPEPPNQVRHYSAWHRRRLDLKPGITGLAQVKGLRDSDSLDEKTKHDLEYAANFSPLLDLTLALATPATLLKRRKNGGLGREMLSGSGGRRPRSWSERPWPRPE
jgi:lipopolysaccharide/colanic/teichoic acid biosynthesis glycosyltransferase